MSDEEHGNDTLLDAALDTSKDDYSLDGDTSLNADDATYDPELEAIKARVKEMEEEAQKLSEMQKEVEESLMSPTASAPVMEDKKEVDARSIYVGNVDYSATAAELEQHFHGCGAVNRVTILCDKFSGHPKGFAYVEFSDKDSIQNAVSLNDSLFKGRQIKVVPKRTNLPGLTSTDRGYRARGRGYSRGYRGYGGFGGGGYGFSPRPYRGRGAYRSRRASWYSPY